MREPPLPILRAVQVPLCHAVVLQQAAEPAVQVLRYDKRFESMIMWVLKVERKVA